MSQIIVDGLVKTFRVSRAYGRAVGRRRGPGAADAQDGTGAGRDFVHTRCRANWSATSAPTAPASRRRSRALAGILVPDSGRCEVLGRVPWRERIAHVSRIGVVFGQRTQLWWDLPGHGIVRAAARHLSRAAARIRRRTRRADRPAGSGAAPRRPGAAAQPRPAHALRSRRGAAARAADPVPRRADDRPRCASASSPCATS